MLVDTQNATQVNLLERFNSITEADIKQAKSRRTTEEYNLSKNMYIAIWRPISSAPKRDMTIIKEEIGT